MVSKMRLQRINERMREELSEILIMEVSDPRLEGISITDVSVDRELTFADIYYSSVEGSDRAQEILDGLLHAQGFLRHALAERMDLRVFPRLRFHWDPTFERAEKIEKLFATLHDEQSIPSSSSDEDLENHSAQDE